MSKKASKNTGSKNGFSGFIGKRITLFCMNYFYTGKLNSISGDEACLTEASIVYETGAFNEANWKDAQQLPHPVYVRVSAIESYMILK